MSSRPVLAAALVLGCGWVTSLAQQAPASVETSAVVASDTEASRAAVPTAGRSISPADAARRRGNDESAPPAVAIQLASNDAGPAAAAAPATRAATDNMPGEWVLVGAGVWLMVAVSRRRKRTPAH